MALGLKTMIQISGRIQLQPQLGGIMDFSTVMIPVLDDPRAENHDTNFRENQAPAPTGRYHGFQSNSIQFWWFEVGLALL